MKWLLFLVLLALAVLVIAAMAKKRRDTSSDENQPWPYYAKKPLSAIEQVMYYRLVEAMPECIVLAQVQLSRVIGVKKGAGPGNWLNRINQKSLDYVVCMKDAAVIAAIELDDSTHEREDRKKSDQDKERALSSAGVKLIRWKAKSLPDVETIRRTFTS